MRDSAEGAQAGRCVGERDCPNDASETLCRGRQHGARGLLCFCGLSWRVLNARTTAMSLPHEVKSAFDDLNRLLHGIRARQDEFERRGDPLVRESMRKMEGGYNRLQDKIN